MSKEAYEFVLRTIREHGSMSTDEAVDLAMPHYEFEYDPIKAKRRDVRRYLGRMLGHERGKDGVRSVFLEKSSSRIVDVEHCHDAPLVNAVTVQLRTNAVGAVQSYKKSYKRNLELSGQISMFNESVFLQNLTR